MSSETTYGCSRTHRFGVGGTPGIINGLEDELRDPVEGLEASISAAVGDELWVRGLGPLLPDFGSGCDLDADPEAFCREEFDFPIASWRVRCDPPQCVGGKTRPSACSWNIEADRLEMTPSRLQTVIAHSAEDQSVVILRHITASGGLSLATLAPLCREGSDDAFAETETSGALGHHEAVVVPPPPPVPCEM